MPAPALNWNINVYNFCYSLDSFPINLVLRNPFISDFIWVPAWSLMKLQIFSPSRTEALVLQSCPQFAEVKFLTRVPPSLCTSSRGSESPSRSVSGEEPVVPGMPVRILQWRVRWSEGRKEWETLGPKMMLKFTQPSIVSISGSLIKLKLNSK